MSTRRERKLRRLIHCCRGCGKYKASHYVPPGLGIPGFYLCQPRPLAPNPKDERE